MAKKTKPRILVTAGPTREKIDPVRFISNYSTGTFGYAIADAARKMGLSVTLVSGPVALDRPEGVRFIGVESALDMRRAVIKEAKRADCIIMAAAVSDWRPGSRARSKIKKGSASISLKLVKNPDILKELGRQKRGKVLAGFALETEDLLKNAAKKLKEKNLDIIIANKLGPGADIFGNKPVKIAFIDRFGGKEEVPAGPKARMAKIILDKVLAYNI
jgi:phosphopantothenoylcysteine decarboxylase / phosphopantothenate---cysteine ligase